MCLLFAILVLTLTAVWVWVLRDKPFTYLAYAMFFPGAVAVGLSAYDGTLIQFVVTVLGLQKPVLAGVFSVIAGILVYVTVYGCVVVAVTAGWAVRSKTEKTGIHEHNQSWLPGFLRAAGEEIGWRSFLLPCLMTVFDPTMSILLSGLCWGLYHVPVMILLGQKLKPEHPVFTVVVQCLSCVLAAFPHSWVAIKSGHSLWASTVLHWLWNRVNPEVLGSIYTQTPGKFTGRQWLINGEGLTGCLVLFPVAIATVWELSNNIV